MRPYAKLIALLVLPLLFVLWNDYRDCILPAEQDDVLQIEPPKQRSEEPSVEDHLDSLGRDTTQQRILFFGDSMVEGLARRLSDYATENGDSLMTICWYGSDSQKWAETDTLDHYLRLFRPTYIMVTLCGNEQFVRDLPQREEYLRQLLSRIQHVPYVWISTPSWKPDTGIGELIRSLVGEARYFDSTRLTFNRGKDHIHPTFGSSERWMDSVAVWLQHPEREHPIRLNPPKVKRPRHWRQIVILTEKL